MGETEATKDLLDEIVRTQPDLVDRLARQILSWLHREGHATIDSVYREARAGVGPEGEADPNRPSSSPLAADERAAVREASFRRAAAVMTPEQLQEIVDLLRRRDEAESLESIASLPDVSFEVLADALRRFCALPRGTSMLPPAQTTGIRVALMRKFISDQLEFIGVAKGFLRIVDFEWIVDRMIGPDRGQGKIGGKAAGMYLGWRILQGATHEHLDTPAADVDLPESWFLRSDVIEEFIRANHLDEFQDQKYKSAEEIRDDYPLIHRHFLNAEFPEEIVRKLEKLLVAIGNHPVIVRSSSLLEDRFGAAFSGMYSSIFLGNQGPMRDRLAALLHAVAEVFASTLAPNPLLYRRRHNLIDYIEDMAILIQKVVGRPHGRYLFPDVAGVAFSRNEYRWSPRLKSEDGMARIVFGLGTRAVDRTGNDHSRLVALGAPRLRTEVTPEMVQRYSQRQIDVIDLNDDGLCTTDLAALLDEGETVPGLEWAASMRTPDGVVEPTGALTGMPADRLCLTFDRLLGRTRFALTLRERLRRLEDAYGCPINVEFAQVGGKFYLLQCRPLVQATEAASRGIPPNVPRDRHVFFTRGLIRSGEVRDIEYVVFVDPRAYDALGSTEERADVARAVARINDALENKNFVLLGPGRWGSNDSRLGVKIAYADINHCRVLIEVAFRKGDYVPEVSYGTHFFQDLVEDGIFYLALQPEEERSFFRDAFFMLSENAIERVSPRDAALARVIRVIRVADAAPGRALHLAMDGDAGEALCWLE